MLPAWAVNLTTQFGIALVKWGLAEIDQEVRLTKELSELERSQNIRNGKNAKAYFEAQTRAEQIRAAVNLLNRSDV